MIKWHVIFFPTVFGFLVLETVFSLRLQVFLIKTFTSHHYILELIIKRLSDVIHEVRLFLAVYFSYKLHGLPEIYKNNI